MIVFNVGLEAEVLLTDKNGDIISPSYKIPMDGSGIQVEIRSKYADNPKECIENFYRKLEDIKELCQPNLILIKDVLKTSKINDSVFKKISYSYKYYKKPEYIFCGLHVHISISFFNKNIRININDSKLIEELDNAFFKKYINALRSVYNEKNDIYRNKQYSKKIYGFEYRALPFNEKVLKEIPDIVNNTFEILTKNKHIKELYIKDLLGNFDISLSESEQDELISYSENLYRFFHK